jgi:hypothetical protein
MKTQRPVSLLQGSQWPSPFHLRHNEVLSFRPANFEHRWLHCIGRADLLLLKSPDYLKATPFRAAGTTW